MIHSLSLISYNFIIFIVILKLSLNFFEKFSMIKNNFASQYKLFIINIKYNLCV